MYTHQRIYIYICTLAYTGTNHIYMAGVWLWRSARDAVNNDAYGAENEQHMVSNGMKVSSAEYGNNERYSNSEILCMCCMHIQCFTPIYRKAAINEYWYTVAVKAADIGGGLAAVRVRQCVYARWCASAET
jgi:hypothetical protein